MSDNTIPEYLWIEFRSGYTGFSTKPFDSGIKYVNAETAMKWIREADTRTIDVSNMLNAEIQHLRLRITERNNELAAVRKEYTEDLPALLAMVGCATVEELAGQYRNLCAKVVFGQIDGATIDKAEAVLQKWNGDV